MLSALFKSSSIRVGFLVSSLILYPVYILSQGSVQSTQKKQTAEDSQGLPRHETPNTQNTQEANTPHTKDTKDTKETKTTENSGLDRSNEKKESAASEPDFDSLLRQELDGIQPEASSDKKAESVSWSWQILKTFLVLFFLIGFFGIAWKLYLFRKKMPSQESGVMQVLYEYDLSGSRRISIVQLASRLLVLGVSDSGIQLITEITDKHTIDQVKLDCDKERGSEKPDFLWELTKVIKNKFSDWKTSSKMVSQSILNPRLGSGFDPGLPKSKAEAQHLDHLNQLREKSKSRIQNMKNQKSFFRGEFQTDES